MNKNKTTNLTFYVAIYWFVFWLFNGADKFLNHTSIGPLTWYGKDRDWQFSVYLTNMKIPTEWVGFIIYFAGLWEIIVAVIFVAFIIRHLVKHDYQQNTKLYDFGLKISFMTFVGFCAFDVVAGDRAELLEHSTYIGVVGVSYLIFFAENAMKDISFANKTQTDEQVAEPNSLKPIKKTVPKVHANSNEDDFDDSDIIHTLRSYRKVEERLY